MNITFIRHTSVDVPPGVCYGQTDVPLRSTFPQEAANVRMRLQASLAQGEAFDQVFTSPLSRCTRLAEYCGYREAKRDPRLLELDFGTWEMQPFATNTDPRLAEWYADYLHIPATGGESFTQQYRRVSAFLDELRTCPYDRVLATRLGAAAARLIAKEEYGYMVEESPFRLVRLRARWRALCPFYHKSTRA